MVPSVHTGCKVCRLSPALQFILLARLEMSADLWKKFPNRCQVVT